MFGEDWTLTFEKTCILEYILMDFCLIYSLRLLLFIKIESEFYVFWEIGHFSSIFSFHLNERFMEFSFLLAFKHISERTVWEQATSFIKESNTIRGNLEDSLVSIHLLFDISAIDFTEKHIVIRLEVLISNICKCDKMYDKTSEID